MYDAIKGFFVDGLYSTDDVKIFVVAGWITEEEYKEITAIDYVA